MPFFIRSTSDKHPNVARITKGGLVGGAFPSEAVCGVTEVLVLLCGLVDAMLSLLCALLEVVVAIVLLVWRGLVEVVVVM